MEKSPKAANNRLKSKKLPNLITLSLANLTDRYNLFHRVFLSFENFLISFRELEWLNSTQI